MYLKYLSLSYQKSTAGLSKSTEYMPKNGDNLINLIRETSKTFATHISIKIIPS